MRSKFTFSRPVTLCPTQEVFTMTIGSPPDWRTEHRACKLITAMAKSVKRDMIGEDQSDLLDMSNKISPPYTVKPLPNRNGAVRLRDAFRLPPPPNRHTPRPDEQWVSLWNVLRR